MNEEQDLQNTEEPSQTEGIEPESTTTIETPLGDATRTIEVDSTTGEPIERIDPSDWEQMINVLQSIDSKTITTTSEGVPLSLTYEQGEQIISLLQTLETAGLTVIFVCLVVFVFRWIYKLFAGTFFGGL